MLVPDGGVAAVPDELVRAAGEGLVVADALHALPGRLAAAAAGGGCSGGAAAALQGLVAAWSPAMRLLADSTGGLAVLVEATAGEFERAGGG